MTGVSLRYQDFEVDARARLTETATYSQAEVEAIRRAAFAAGDKAGAQSALETVAAARADHAAALADALQQIEAMQRRLDRHLQDSLNQLEAVLRSALAISLPSSTGALQRLPDALQHLAEVSPPLAIEALASPETEQALRSVSRPLPERLRFVSDPGLPFGSVRLRWRGGGAVFSADAAHEAMQSLVLSALSVAESDKGIGQRLSQEPVSQPQKGASHDQ